MAHGIGCCCGWPSEERTGPVLGEGTTAYLSSGTQNIQKVERKEILRSKSVAKFVMKIHDHWCTTACEDVHVIHLWFICYVRPEKVKDEKRPWILRAREAAIQIESTTVHEENQSLPQTLIYISCGWESFKEVYVAFKSILENLDWDAALWSLCLHTICLNYHSVPSSFLFIRCHQTLGTELCHLEADDRPLFHAGLLVTAS